MATVSLSSVTKRFGDVVAVDDVSLDIADEEFMVLVGPSGCGKSTLLRMLAGLEEVDGGTISIADRVVNDVPPKSRDIAMVFQNYALYPHMSVRENLEFGLKMRKVSKADRATRVLNAANILAIHELLERKPRQLSGGQRQRVAVGRAIVREPAVFLFDEPLSNLDAKLRSEMRTELTKLQRALKTTTVYVTHDQIEAMTMGHRIAVLERGRLQQVDTPMRVYESPANLFVASFIGTPPMNILTGTLTEDAGAVRVRSHVLPLPAMDRSALAPHLGLPISIGIRPEHVSLEAGESGSGTLPGVVEIVETLGHEIVVHCRMDDSLMTAKTPPGRVPTPGDPIRLGLPARSLHVFSPDSGTRLGPAC